VLPLGYMWSAGKTGLWGDDRDLPLTDLDAPELAAEAAASFALARSARGCAVSPGA
jgi:hypothetical protein